MMSVRDAELRREGVRCRFEAVLRCAEVFLRRVDCDGTVSSYFYPDLSRVVRSAECKFISKTVTHSDQRPA
jgi:hypothetical protein